MAPVAVIRYATAPPGAAAYYPFGLDVGPEVPPFAGTALHLSAEWSLDRAGQGLEAVWSVLDPVGEPVQVHPEGAAARAWFELVRRGEHSVALHVTSLAEPRLTDTAELYVRSEAWRCSEDGTGPICGASDAVPGGDFVMGSLEGDASERPEHIASVAAFELDRFEVTVGRFTQFVEAYTGATPVAGAGAYPRRANSGWRDELNLALPASRQQLELALDDCGGTWRATSAGRDALPINCVSWYEAFAFCIWDGGRLPSEAEWEYAAAGGSEERRYAWGDAEPTLDRAIYGCRFDADPACSEADLPPVGNAPGGAGRFGHQDLAGSLWEWTLDQYAAYSAEACTDCATLDGGEGRVFRGGDFRSDDPSALRSAARIGFLAEQRDPARGFRCARSAPAEAR